MKGEGLRKLILTREEKLAAAKKFTLFSDVFMSVALDDIEACQHVIRIILKRPDLIVKSVRTQYEISKIISHGIRLDVLAEDSKNRLYNIEIQKKDDQDHAKRSRYYGAVLDSEFLEKGADYTKLPELHIIYISEKDIWNGGCTSYTVKKTLGETGIPYEDGVYVHYINAAVDDGSEIAKLMKYFLTADPSDNSQGKLSERVQLLKNDERSEGKMCEASERLIKIGEMVGEARGEARAEDRLNTLNLKLLAEKRYNDLERSAQDKDYQKKLCREFGL